MSNKPINEDDADKSRGRGRPTIYSNELGKAVCSAIATHSHGLKRLSAMYDWMPAKTTILAWRLKHPDFKSQYAHAKAAQAESLAEECIDIADDRSKDLLINSKGEEVPNAINIMRDKIRIDTRKWTAARLAPKIYGDTKRVEELEGQNDSLRAELKALRFDLDEENKREY